MAQERALLDTDTLSAIMRRDPDAVPRAREYLTDHGRFTFSLITRYEILRGLMAKAARRQAQAFEQFCSTSEILSLDGACIVRAAEIYADLHRRGELIGDADILIAASAQVHGLRLVTNNEAHFRRIPGLPVDNWLRV